MVTSPFTSPPLATSFNSRPGATATNQQKDATLETGLTTRVPPFISIGEVIRISTDDKSYMSRA